MVVSEAMCIAPALFFSLTVTCAIICAVTFKAVINTFVEQYDRSYIFSAVDFLHIHESIHNRINSFYFNFIHYHIL